MSFRAVFLDRDGVLNRAILRDGRPYPPMSVDDVEVLPGVREALRRLGEAGFRLVVVTNQPDVARGRQRREVVDAIHLKLSSLLPIHEFRVCFHDDSDRCACRKPHPGMIVDAAHEHDIDLSRSYMVGDRWRDVEAGKAAGCTTILIDGGYEEHLLSEPAMRVRSLLEAANWILSRTSHVS